MDSAIIRMLKELVSKIGIFAQRSKGFKGSLYFKESGPCPLQWRIQGGWVGVITPPPPLELVVILKTYAKCA